MQTIINLFSAHGTFVQPDALEYILSKDDPNGFCKHIMDTITEIPLVLTIDFLKNLDPATDEQVFLTKASLDEKNLQKKMLSKLLSNQILRREEEDETDEDTDEAQNEMTLETNKGLSSLPPICSPVTWRPFSKDYDSNIRIIKDITGKSTCEGTTDDFTKLFANRFDVLREQLRKHRRELSNVLPISRMRKSGLKDIQLVGIVNEIRTTQNGNRLIELEDDTGMVAAIILQSNRDAFQTAQTIVTDEVLGITGQLSNNKDLFLVNSVIFPDISLHNRKHAAEEPLYAAFLSDIHVGSKDFMEKQWYSFLRWINGDLGNSRQKDVAGKIKYLVVPGDIVDGIGIYPNQEKELSIIDLYKQYEALASYFTSIPDHISIIIQPGNHDAVRPAEPQPTFDKEIQKLFSNNDVTFVANPSYFSLHGVEILSYHGSSLLDYATNIQHLQYNEPIEIMKVMLQKHHLAPMYGGYTPLAPEKKDYMIIDQIPDIFVTGHVHLATLGEYRGVTLINASSWQDQTSYQKMLNFIPDPAKLPIVDLQSGKVTMMDFNKQM